MNKKEASENKLLEPINAHIIKKTSPDGKYGLGINNKPYKKRLGAYNINGENHLAIKWIRVHPNSYENIRAYSLLNNY